MVVAVDGRAAREGTPGWMLPVATIGAVVVSALTVIAIAQAGHQPLSSVQAEQFIAGCQNSATGAVADCQCFLNQLEADGYDTPDALNNLVADAQSEEASGRFGPSRTALQNALIGCQRGP